MNRFTKFSEPSPAASRRLQRERDLGFGDFGVADEVVPAAERPKNVAPGAARGTVLRDA